MGRRLSRRNSLVRETVDDHERRLSINQGMSQPELVRRNSLTGGHKTLSSQNSVGVFKRLISPFILSNPSPTRQF